MTRHPPWHDTPTCKACGGPVIMDAEMGLSPRCGACGALFKNATAEEKSQIARAEAAWERVLAGEVHEDKACARCGGCLPIEQQRLCPACVRADASERNLSLFPA